MKHALHSLPTDLLPLAPIVLDCLSITHLVLVMGEP